jgi:hypothetical protein
LTGLRYRLRDVRRSAHWWLHYRASAWLLQLKHQCSLVGAQLFDLLFQTVDFIASNAQFTLQLSGPVRLHFRASFAAFRRLRAIELITVVDIQFGRPSLIA